jgi:hypothetical protein
MEGFYIAKLRKIWYTLRSLLKLNFIKYT